MDILTLTAAQLAVGLILSCTLGIMGTIAYSTVAEYFYRDEPNVAEVRSIGRFQYDNDFFTKIEEFRNDFA